MNKKLHEALTEAWQLGATHQQPSFAQVCKWRDLINDPNVSRDTLPETTDVSDEEVRKILKEFMDSMHELNASLRNLAATIKNH